MFESGRGGIALPTKASKTPHARRGASYPAKTPHPYDPGRRVDSLFGRIEAALLAAIESAPPLEEATPPPIRSRGGPRSSRRTRAARQARALEERRLLWAAGCQRPPWRVPDWGPKKVPRSPSGRLCRELELVWQIRWTVEAFPHHGDPAWQVLDHAGDLCGALDLEAAGTRLRLVGQA